jgi:hypothetical protein
VIAAIAQAVWEWRRRKRLDGESANSGRSK